MVGDGAPVESISDKSFAANNSFSKNKRGLKDVDIISASIKSRMLEGSSVCVTKFNTTPIHVNHFELSLKGTGCPVDNQSAIKKPMQKGS
jgi:hypothetical protein